MCVCVCVCVCVCACVCVCVCVCVRARAQLAQTNGILLQANNNYNKTINYNNINTTGNEEKVSGYTRSHSKTQRSRRN